MRLDVNPPLGRSLGRVAGVSAIVCAGLVSLAAQQAPVFRATGAVVTVDVAVRNGRVLVPGLTSADFSLTDNGIAERIDATATDAVPIDLTVLLDVSASATVRMGVFKDETQALVKLLRPTDRVRVLTVGAQVRELVGFEPAPSSLSLVSLTSGGSTSLVDGVLFALQDAPNPDRQPLVVVFTDGGENSSIVSGATLTDAAARGDAVLDVVLAEAPAGPATVQVCRDSPDGPWSNFQCQSAAKATTQSDGTRVLSLFTPEMYWRGDAPRQPEWIAQGAAATRFDLPFIPVLQEAASVTGGELLDANANLTGAFRNVVDDFRHSYVLRYAPSGVPPAGWHDVVVTVPAHPDWTVTARKRYFGG